MKVRDSFRNMFEFCGGDPGGFFFGTFASSPFDEVLQLTLVSSAELGVEDFGDLIFGFTIEVD